MCHHAKRFVFKVIAALVCLGIGFLLYDSFPSETYGWLIVVFMMLYLFTNGVELSSAPWAFNAEVRYVVTYSIYVSFNDTESSSTANI